ncbi:hypothetical protein AB0L57_27425 [Nocardia sp. NPDC052254]|uniref:hypothetical protein n=1 Tax=Nocardia sp. NPDC052254 TaxID=3155681 RepID=UPI003414024E
MRIGIQTNHADDFVGVVDEIAEMERAKAGVTTLNVRPLAESSGARIGRIEQLAALIRAAGSPRGPAVVAATDQWPDGTARQE